MDYKEMYLKMMRASEEAIRILIQAQQECEEMYVSAEDPELTKNYQGTTTIIPPRSCSSLLYHTKNYQGTTTAPTY